MTPEAPEREPLSAIRKAGSSDHLITVEKHFRYYTNVEGMKEWEAKKAAGMTDEEFALHCEREAKRFNK